jgi:DNA-binding NtrC family response regulator
MSRDCILYVEDDLLCSSENSEVIREGGFDVVEACCAAEAAAVIDRHDPLAALVTDIDLGEGADGFEVARHARSAYPGLPVIYVSAAAAARISLEGLKGADFIAKPFRAQQIIDALRRAIKLDAVLSRLDAAAPHRVWSKVNKTPPDPFDDRAATMTAALP